MSIFQEDMLTGLNKIETAIELIVAFEPPHKPYQVGDSGGKDSGVVVHLTKLAEPRLRRKPDYVYCASPIDPPEIHQFLKEERPETQWEYHARNFLGLVVKNGLPRRQGRWCCRFIKEASGLGRTVIVGNRREEGSGRSKQKCFEAHLKVDKVFVRPIINWTTGEVWEYTAVNNLKVCSLYSEGFHRIGCVLCPFHRNVKYEMERFPKITNLWWLGCKRIHEDRLARGKNDTFKTPEERFYFWLDRDAKRKSKEQLSLTPH